MKYLIVLLLVLVSCFESKKESKQVLESQTDKVQDTIRSEFVHQENGKKSIYELLDQKIEINNVENKENLEIFNGFNGLKIGKNFTDFSFGKECKVLIDANVNNFNYKKVQFVPKLDDIKSGRGSIMFITLVFLDDVLEEIEINQAESWQVSKSEYESKNFSRGLKFNSFIEIFRSAFGDPDNFQYFIMGSKIKKMLGDFDDNIDEIHNQYNKTQNNNDLTSIDMDWQNDRLIYFLSVSPKDMNYLSPNSNKKTISLNSYLLIQNKITKKNINKITSEIARKENLAREKNRENKQIQNKKSSIQSL